MPGTLYCPVIGRQHFWTPHIYHFQLLKCHFWVYIFCLDVRLQAIPKQKYVTYFLNLFKKWEWINQKVFMHIPKVNSFYSRFLKKLLCKEVLKMSNASGIEKNLALLFSRPKEKYLVDLFCCQQINGLFKKVWWLDTSWSIIQGLLELRRKKRVDPLEKFCSDILLRNVTTKFSIKFTCRTKIASMKKKKEFYSLSGFVRKSFGGKHKTTI